MKMSFLGLIAAVGILATLAVGAKNQDPLASLLIKHQNALIHLLEDYELVLNSTQETCSIEGKMEHLSNQIEKDVLPKLNGVLLRLGDLEAHELPKNATGEKFTRIEHQIQSLGNIMEIEMVSRLNEMRSRIDHLEGSWNDTRDLILLNKSSTGPVCKDDWIEFQGVCYLFAPIEASWEEGRELCLGMGSDYVKIPTVDVFHFLQSHVKNTSWIGLNDRKTEGHYIWVSDGQEADIPKTWWHRGEPNNDHKGSEDCCEFWIHRGQPLLNDAQCHEKHNYICEMKSRWHHDPKN